MLRWLFAIIFLVLPTACEKEHRAIEGVDPFHAENPPLPPQERGLIPIQKEEKEKKEQFPVPPPPLSEGIYPCSSCHAEIEPNPKRRKLEFHEDIVFEHDEEHRWCLDCHDIKNRDKLRLANGELIGFEESYRLCGQCHGPQYRDWKVGVHGKRTGMWKGEKEYLLCAHCHNPHSPRFKPLKPKPPPARPEDIR